MGIGQNEIVLHLVKGNQKGIYCKNGWDFSRRESYKTKCETVHSIDKRDLFLFMSILKLKAWIQI